jgi:hypothetical protein
MNLVIDGKVLTLGATFGGKFSAEAYARAVADGTARGLRFHRPKS